MISQILSDRATETISALDVPWRFALRGTYHPDTNPSGLISFATAENVLVTEEIEAFVKENLTFSAEDFLYRGSQAGGPRFPAVLAGHLNEYLQPHRLITSDMIQCVGAATSMHDILAWGIANPGNGFLTSRPVYGRFELDFGNKSQVKVVYADTRAEDSFDPEVALTYERALMRSNAMGVRVKAVFIVNPHNPLGRCYPRSTLINLMKFCQMYQIHLISDEIYACSVFDSGEPNATPFTSILSIDTDKYIDPELLHVTYGLSKDFGVAGLRLGAIITRSKPVHRAVETAMRFHNPSGASLAIGTAMLEDRKWCRAFIESSREKLAEAYRHVTKGLQAIGLDYLAGSNAGFFIWVDLSPYLLPGENAEFVLAQKLKDNGVFLHPQEEHSLRPGHFRIVFTQDPRMVTEGLRRIKKAISSSHRTA